jgi:hypothetical protein
MKGKTEMIISRMKTATLFFAVCATLAVAPAYAQEEKKDAFVCVEETQEKCDYENKNLQLFIQGRDAFERGRESGDLSEARNIARELIDRGDKQHGSALMKFIYVQVGQGVHKNLVEAYRWVSADMADGATYRRLNLERVLEQLAARMSPEQLAEAKK